MQRSILSGGRLQMWDRMCRMASPEGQKRRPGPYTRRDVDLNMYPNM